jgi:hypothetical protein
MKLRATNQIALSHANAKALVKAYEDRQAGHASAYPMVYKQTEDGLIGVSIESDEEHYTESELAERKSPYLAPEAWAGVL